MAQVMFDTQRQAHQPYPRSKVHFHWPECVSLVTRLAIVADCPQRDPLTPDDSSGTASNKPQYSYRNPSNPPRLNPVSTQPTVGQGSHFQPVKEEPHLYQFQSNQS